MDQGGNQNNIALGGACGLLQHPGETHSLQYDGEANNIILSVPGTA